MKYFFLSWKLISPFSTVHRDSKTIVKGYLSMSALIGYDLLLSFQADG